MASDDPDILEMQRLSQQVQSGNLTPSKPPPPPPSMAAPSAGPEDPDIAEMRKHAERVGAGVAYGAKPPVGVYEDIARVAPASLTGKPVAGLLGAPRDIGDALGSGLDRLGNRVFGDGTWDNTDNYREEQQRHQTHVLPGSADVRAGMEKVTGPWYEAQTLPGKYVGEGMDIGVQTLLSGGSGALRAYRLGEGALTVGKEALKDLGPRMAVQGMAPAAGGAAADVLFPDNPLAHAAGQLLGGVGGAAAEVGAMRATAPFRANGRLDLANDRLRAKGVNPDDIEAAQAGMPGWQTKSSEEGGMSLGQTLGSRPVREAEQNAANDPAYRARFYDAEMAQRRAQANTFDNIQNTGDPADLANSIRHTNAANDAHFEDAIQRAQQEFEARTGRMGGAGDVDGYGETLRKHLGEAYDASRARTGALWDHFRQADADGRLPGVSTQPLKALDSHVYDSLSDTERRFVSPIENQFRDLIAGYGDNLSLHELHQLGSEIGAQIYAMKFGAGGISNNKAIARLAQLRGGIDDAIERTISGEAAFVRPAAEAAAPGRGLTFEQQADEWLRNRRSGTGLGAATSDGTAVPGGASGVPPIPDAPPGGAQPGGGAAVPGARGPADLLRPVTESDRSRLQEAMNATKAEKRTFVDSGTANAAVLKGHTLATGYTRPADKVVGRIFAPGPEGGRSAYGYLHGTGNSQQAKDALINAAQNAYRREVLQAANPLAKHDAFLTKYADALRAVPEAADQFRSVATARRAIDMASSAKAVAQAEAARGLMGKITASTDPEEVIQQIGKLIDGHDIPTIRRLAAQARTPEAQAGLRRAAADAMRKKLTSTMADPDKVDLLKPGDFRRMIRTRRLALREMGFSPEQMRSMEQIADHIQGTGWKVRTNGGSNTTQDMLQMVQHLDKSKPGFLDTIFLAQAGAGAGAAMAGPLGAVAGGIGSVVANRWLRPKVMEWVARNEEKVNDMVVAAMLDPNYAKTMLRSRPISAIDMEKQLNRNAARARYIIVGIGAANGGN